METQVSTGLKSRRIFSLIGDPRLNRSQQKPEINMSAMAETVVEQCIWYLNSCAIRDSSYSRQEQTCLQHFATGII